MSYDDDFEEREAELYELSDEDEEAATDLSMERDVWPLVSRFQAALNRQLTPAELRAIEYDVRYQWEHSGQADIQAAFDQFWNAQGQQTVDQFGRPRDPWPDVTKD